MAIRKAIVRILGRFVEMPAGDSLAVLSGGATGQVLAKASATDHDYSWQTIAGGGGGGPQVYAQIQLRV